jgi:16S rRNA (guanine966-N2)-methyltransferase
MGLRISGNRLLKTLPGDLTRPTLGRVRQALFNIWQVYPNSVNAQARWLDICSGSGSIGAEALLRGATRVVGIEQSPRACTVIQANWQTLAQSHQQFQVLRGDALKLLPTLAGQQFDYLYCDPPYASGLYQPVVEAIAHFNLLAPDGKIALEHSALEHSALEHSTLEHSTHNWAIALPDGLEIIQTKRYGSSALTFLRRSD